MSEFPLSEGMSLSWELRNQAADSGEIGEGTYDPLPFPYWPEDSDEEISIQINLSLNQYTALMSAIDIGAAIGYGGDSLKVKWMLWRNFQGDAMTFCEQMIGCIEEDEDVKDAISHMLKNFPDFQEFLSEWINDHPTGSFVGKNTPIDPATTITYECDLDLLFAQCIGIVQTANRMTQDFLETWETYTNSAETIPAIVLAIPLLGEVADVIGVDGIAAYANSIIDAIKEGYEADYTLEYENALACEIFCAAQADCTVTLEMLTNIMNARISGQLTLTNGIELMLSLIDADISGINVADLYLCAFYNMLTLANLVLPITWGIESYLRVIRTFNVANDDWTILCDECSVIPDACVDFTAGQGTWIPYNDEPENAQFDSNGIGQINNTYLTITGVDYTDVNHVTITFSGPIGSNDYYKYYVSISNIDASNFQTFGGVFSLLSDNPVTLTTTGANWDTLRIQIIFGGFGYPPRPEATTPVYITEICVNA